TARQVALIAGRLSAGESQRRGLLESIRPTPVIHYCGHMFAAGWQQERHLAEEVRSILDEADVLVGYGQLACGADILIAEALLDRGGELHVVLPFAEEDFIKSSVAVGGPQWVSRYEKVRDGASSVTFATQMQWVNDDQQFSYCAKLVMGLAQLRASVMQADTFQLAVWDGEPTAAIAGTAAHCAEWAGLGGNSRVISVPKERPALAMPEATHVPEKASWKLCSMLFADFAGFSL